MKNLRSEGFAIWDHADNKWWTSPRGKKLWGAAGHAKNGWNSAHGYRMGRLKTPFSKQNRYEVKPVAFMEIPEEVPNGSS